MDNEWTAAWVQPAYTAEIGNKVYYAVLLPDDEAIPDGAVALDSVTVDKDTGTVTVVYRGDSYTATPSAVDVAKPKPQSIVIDGVIYTRS